MARPLKEGLDYFPLDVDIESNDKITIVEANHGSDGFMVIIKLFAKIYKEGYFYEWTERERKLFARRVNVNINSLTDIVNDCIEEDLFDKRLFNEYSILTSMRIQCTYLEAAKRRKQVVFAQKYFLIDDVSGIVGSNKVKVLLENEDGFRINVNNNGVNVNINAVSEDIDDNISTQRKEKKRKEKESKEYILRNFDSFWSIYPRKKDKKKALEKFKAAVDRHKGNYQVIIDGASNYAKHCEVKKKEEQYIKLAATFLNADSFMDEFDLTPDNRGQPRKENHDGRSEAARKLAEENGLSF
jgi:hypothetical protein